MIDYSVECVRLCGEVDEEGLSNYGIPASKKVRAVFLYYLYISKGNCAHDSR
jgi:hypothetical protein